MTRLFFNPLTGLFFRIKARPVRRKAPVNPEVERLRALAKEELPPRLARLAAIHGFRYNKVFIKNNASNWGSCSSLGNINLNLRLVKLPQELQDYVMLHELCHLKEMNHSKRFWREVEKILPDYKESVKWFKDNGEALMSRMTVR